MALKQKRPRKKPTPAQNAAYEQHRAQLEKLGVQIPDIPLEDDSKKFSPKDTAQRRALILAWLSRGYTKARACAEAQITTRTLSYWRAEDEEFNKKCKEAIDIGTDHFEDEARRRAVEGVDRPVFQQGECVGFIREYSDTLLTTMLGGRRPDMYGRQRVEHSGPGGAPIKYETEVTFVTPKDK